MCSGKHTHTHTQGDQFVVDECSSGSTSAVRSAAISVFGSNILHCVHTLIPSVNTLLNIVLCVCVCAQEAPLYEELHSSELVCLIHASSRGRARQRHAAVLR